MDEMVEKQTFEDAQNSRWGFLRWCGVSADYVGHELGEEALEKYLTAVGQSYARPMMEMGAAEMLRMFARPSKASWMKMELREDDKKIVVTNHLCGTGGRMEREGITHKLTKGKYKGLTPYCAHCSLWWNKLAKEWYGMDIEFKYAEGGRGCTWTHHKKA